LVFPLKWEIVASTSYAPVHAFFTLFGVITDDLW